MLEVELVRWAGGTVPAGEGTQFARAILTGVVSMLAQAALAALGLVRSEAGNRLLFRGI